MSVKGSGNRRVRCVGENGAIVRSECELDSDFVGEIDPFQVCLCAAEAKVASNGTSRVRLVSPVSGWVSLRLFADLDGEDDVLRVTVDYRDGKVSLRIHKVELEPSSTLLHLKRSLAAMTRVPLHQQHITQHGENIALQDCVRIKDLPVTDGRILLVLMRAGGENVFTREEDTEDQPPIPSTIPVPYQHLGTIIGRSFTSSKRQPHPGVLQTGDNKLVEG